MRDNFTQIPSAEELQEILAKEASRDIAPDKQNIKYIDFSSIITFLESIHVDSDLFTHPYIKENLKDPKMFEQTSSMVQEVIQKIELADPMLRDGVYEYLAEEDIPGNADYIFIFGSKTHLRMQKAVELWKESFAPKIFISGSRPVYSSVDEGEAETHKRYAIENGVPEESIVIESEAITLPDNVKRSLNMLEEMGETDLKIILVNSPYSQRRGWYHFQKLAPDGYSFVRVNSETKPEYSKEDWYKNEEGIKIVMNEFIKLKVAETLDSE